MDRLFFGKEALKEVESDARLQIVTQDTRSFDAAVLADIAVVVDLAAISQPDPARQLNATTFRDINVGGPARVVRLSKKHGADRYILASTCSVYGFQDGVLAETSPPKPVEIYGETKAQAEQDVLTLAERGFAVTILRFATLYGLSRKMRFDLVVNGMTRSLFRSDKIRVMRDGTQFRPVVHVRDAVQALLQVIQADRDKVGAQIFNVGSNEQNYQVHTLARLIGDTIGTPHEIEWYGDPDTRSYRVNFDKLANTLAYTTDYTPKEGAKEVYEALQRGIITDSPQTNVIEWYKHLGSTVPSPLAVETGGASGRP